MAELPNSNYYKFHSCLFVVTKQEMLRIYLWLYRGQRQYIEDYLRTENLFGQMRLGRHEKLLLNEKTSVANFDISFLYKLLQFTCGLSPAGDKIWNDPDESQKGSLEYTLYCLKDIRNALSHESKDLFSMTHENLRDREKELSRLLAKALELAGEKAKKRDEASRAITEMKDKLQAIISKPISSGFTSENFAVLGRQEIKKLNVKASGFFAEVVVQQAQTATTATTPAPELSLNQLLRWSCEDTKPPNVILVTGDTGTGKTSLCRHIFDSWCSGADTFADLQDCDLVVSIQCSEVCTSDVAQLLSDTLPQTVAACGPYEVLEKLSSLNVLWLVDGYEEATREARSLLQCLVKKRGLLHTILVTTRPEHCIFISNVAHKASLLEVRLLGLSARGRSMVVENLLREPSPSMKKLEDFERELGRLEGEVSRELLNPLKLTLTVKLWKEDRINMKESGTLPQLYSVIKKTHTQSLCIKTEIKTGMTAEECERKVNKWVETLCEEAFKMSKLQKYMQLPEEALNRLRDTCDSLRLYSEDCFSTFLGYQPSALRSGLACYSFLHNTQQFHYAAEHVFLCLARSEDKVSTICQLFSCDASGEIGSHFYMVLLHVVALMTASGAVKKNVTEVLVRLLSHCDRCMWFEVIRYAAYSNDIVSEICKVMPAQWGVCDDDVKAAMQCLDHTSPGSMVINLNGDPKGIEDFIPMVRMIAQRLIFVQLILHYHISHLDCDETSNYILEILCNKDAHCSLIKFSGCISGKGSSYLCNMPKLQSLGLKVLRNKDLGLIMKRIKNLPRLQVIQMNMAMPQLDLLKGLSISQQIQVDIALPKVKEYNINKTVDAIAKITKKYNEMRVFFCEPEQMFKLTTGLQRKKVRVEALQWTITSESGVFEWPCGPVPLDFPPEVLLGIPNLLKSIIIKWE
ncbi:uncharacterized protein LOC125029114 [Penaeus chinensis]|uniref:uncharacterized protein LOC125029114 n=1 Tax=Penaeus chinensis TaxID=139456 RepID=UPI001FB70744|nr:uncharacterized protein LOC125029114 [Penaeus chinensis]